MPKKDNPTGNTSQAAGGPDNGNPNASPLVVDGEPVEGDTPSQPPAPPPPPEDAPPP